MGDPGTGPLRQPRRGARRRDGGARRDRGGDQGGPTRCTSPAGTSRRASASPAGRARCRCATCWPTWRGACRCGCCCGRAAAAAVPAHAERGAPGARRVRPGQPRAVCPRRARAADALPPREARGRRRTMAFVGGIDLTALQGDRLDASRAPAPHLARLARRGGPPAGPGRRRRRRAFPGAWHEITGEQLPRPAPPPAAGDRDVQVLRTVPERTYRFAPRGEFTILEAYLRALRSAERLIYLENQFLWSPEVVDVLADKLPGPRARTSASSLLLPAKPNNGADTTRGQLGRLAGRRRRCRPAAGHHDHRAHAGGGAGLRPRQGGGRRRPLADIGSANLNEHSLFNDTEMNVLAATPRWRGRPGCGSGPSTPSARSTRSRGSRPPSSTPVAADGAGADASGSGRGCRARTSWRCCRACPDVPTGSRDRCAGCWWTGRACRLLSCAGRPCGGWRAW